MFRGKNNKNSVLAVVQTYAYYENASVYNMNPLTMVTEILFSYHIGFAFYNTRGTTARRACFF